jgi:DNA-binding winged helix-turn-helix (wHTH) protein
VSLEGAEERVKASIRFDVFELDAKRVQLRRSGLPVNLPPQALRVLVLIAGRPNELVTRKEIKEVLWPGQSCGDFDSRVNFAVKKLREALGDDAEHPRYVQTVRSAGYRFIAPVMEARSADAAAAVGQVPARAGEPMSRPDRLFDGPPQFGKRGLYVAIAALALAAIGAVAALVFRQPKQSGYGSGVDERTGAQLRWADEEQPRITSVTSISPALRQRVVVRGRGFGLHVPYARSDSPYFAVRDETANWAAGRLIPRNWDEVMVDVESWTDDQIVVSGFSGDYGKGSWKLNVGDDVEVAVWNPQSGMGPARYHTRVVEEISARKK